MLRAWIVRSWVFCSLCACGDDGDGARTLDSGTNLDASLDARTPGDPRGGWKLGYDDAGSPTIQTPDGVTCSAKVPAPFTAGGTLYGTKPDGTYCAVDATSETVFVAQSRCAQPDAGAVELLRLARACIDGSFTAR